MKHVEESYSFGEESSQQGHAALSSGLSHSPHTTRRGSTERGQSAQPHTQAPSPQLRGWCICDTQITMQKTPVSLTRGLIPLNDYAGANVTGAPTVPLLCGCTLTLPMLPNKAQGTNCASPNSMQSTLCCPSNKA